MSEPKELISKIDYLNLVNYLRSSDIEFEENVALSSYSYFKSGGIAAIIIYPATQGQLSDCVNWFYANKVPRKIIGGTSNVLFLDDQKYGCFISSIQMNKLFYDRGNHRLIADCGTMLPDLARMALYESLTGFEGLEGIPGTAGGAVFMNAGAYGYEIKDVLKAVDVVLPDGTAKHYRADELDFCYRSSVFKKEKHEEIIARCYFQAEKGNAGEIYHRMEIFHSKRHKYQEFMYPNLGSLFAGSLYHALGRNDFFYKLVLKAHNLIQYRWKPFRRESPLNRKWLNDFTVKRFGIKYERQPFSDKGMNTLINNGQNTNAVLNYISQLQEKTEDCVPIENEILYGVKDKGKD